jgi:hypothetical protein
MIKTFLRGLWLRRELRWYSSNLCHSSIAQTGVQVYGFVYEA